MVPKNIIFFFLPDLDPCQKSKLILIHIKILDEFKSRLSINSWYLDGNPEIGAHVRSNLCYLICLRHLIRSRAVTRYFLSEKTFFASSAIDYKHLILSVYLYPSLFLTICFCLSVSVYLFLCFVSLCIHVY